MEQSAAIRKRPCTSEKNRIEIDGQPVARSSKIYLGSQQAAWRGNNCGRRKGPRNSLFPSAGEFTVARPVGRLDKRAKVCCC